MTQLEAGSGILFMKVGTHANEDLSDIIRRKRQEIDEAGYGLWGYGGNTCHPSTMVQPFARSHAERSSPILLCMHPMESKHFAPPLRATEFSEDGLKWSAVPAAINALGSRYALCIESLDEVELDLRLQDTRVAVGNSKGKVGSEYVKGRVDKACLEMVEASSIDTEPMKIGLVAKLTSPFAVFLR